MSIIGSDTNEMYIKQFKEQIQLHEMSSKVKAILSNDTNGTNFSGIYDLLEGVKEFNAFALLRLAYPSLEIIPFERSPFRDHIAAL